MPTTQALDFSPSTTASVVVPISGAAEWVTAIAAGGLTVSDVQSGDVVAQSPGSVTHSSRRILTRGASAGTTLRVRLTYSDQGVTYPDSSYPLTIRVFATTNNNSWTVLRNLNGDASVPIPVDPIASGHPGSDTRQEFPSGTPGEFLINQPDNNAHSWDCDGYNKFLIAVDKVFAITGASQAFLEAKIV